MFQDLFVQDTQHHSDYYMVLGYMRGEPTKDLTIYLHKAHRFLLRPLCRYLASAPDKLFSALKIQIPNPPLGEQVKWDWISDKTWVAIEARVTVCWEGGHQTVIQISQHIRTGLSTDQKRRAEEAGHNIKSLPCDRTHFC